MHRGAEGIGVRVLGRALGRGVAQISSGCGGAGLGLPCHPPDNGKSAAPEGCLGPCWTPGLKKLTWPFLE